MTKFIAKTELEKQNGDNKTVHGTGEIYSQIFSHDKDIVFSENMNLRAGIIWLGSYNLDSNLFPKEKCPVCGKEHSLVPYQTVGSILSGAHTILFYCPYCREKFVTNDFIEYFRLIYKYILEHRDEFSKDQILNNCTSFSGDVMFV